MRTLVIISGIVGLILQSCNYGILYHEPQPLNGRNIESFPENLRGIYSRDTAQNAIIILSKHLIKVDSSYFASSIHDVDTSKEYVLIGDSLMISDNNWHESIPVKLRDDSIFGYLPVRDTIINLLDKDLIRRYRGDYYLNKRASDSTWNVIKLDRISSRKLIFSIIPQNVEYTKLNMITTVTEMKNDSDSTINYIINPSRKELRKLNNSGLFSKKERYSK